MSSDSDRASPAKVLGIVASVIGILTFFGIANWHDLQDFLASDGSNDSSSGSVEEVIVGDCVAVEKISMFSNVASDYQPATCEYSEDPVVYKVFGVLPYDSNAYAWKETWEPTQIGNEMGTCGFGMGWDTNTPFSAFSIYTAEGRKVVCIQLLTN